MAIFNRESHRRAASDSILINDGRISRLDRIILGGGWPGAFDSGGVRAELFTGPAVNLRFSSGPSVKAVLGVTPR